MSLEMNGNLAQRRASVQGARDFAKFGIAQQNFESGDSVDEMSGFCPSAFRNDLSDATNPRDGPSTFPAQQLSIWERQASSNKNATSVTGSAISLESHSRPSPDAPTHLIEPWNKTDNLKTSQFGREFILHQRNLIAQGWPKDMVLGPDPVDIDGIFTDGCPTTQPLTVSQWVAQVASRFDTLGVPERLGLVLLCTRYVKVLFDKLRCVSIH